MKRNEQREQAFILLFEYLFLPQDDLVAIYDENIGTVSDYAKELYTGVLAKWSLWTICRTAWRSMRLWSWQRSTAVRKTPALLTACWVLFLGVRRNDSGNRHQQLHHLCRCDGR